jgi:hypothetical protein
MGKSMERPFEERFREKVDSSAGPDACWPWTAAIHGRRNSKYGSFSISPTNIQQAHRVAWELAKGPIPDDMNVLHSCDNGLCCNPKHLFLGSQADNVHDMVAKGRNR